MKKQELLKLLDQVPEKHYLDIALFLEFLLYKEQQTKQYTPQEIEHSLANDNKEAYIRLEKKEDDNMLWMPDKFKKNKSIEEIMAEQNYTGSGYLDIEEYKKGLPPDDGNMDDILEELATIGK